MLQLSQGGKRPIQLSNGESRVFLQGVDAIVLRGRCREEGFWTIGFGESAGSAQPTLVPAMR